jgi:hypothetical protein
LLQACSINPLVKNAGVQQCSSAASKVVQLYTPQIQQQRCQRCLCVWSSQLVLAAVSVALDISQLTQTATHQTATKAAAPYIMHLPSGQPTILPPLLLLQMPLYATPAAFWVMASLLV